jgi:hypothetical protein
LFGAQAEKGNRLNEERKEKGKEEKGREEKGRGIESDGEYGYPLRTQHAIFGSLIKHTCGPRGRGRF